jgi:ketosteroid isomerase-like protein
LDRVSKEDNVASVRRLIEAINQNDLPRDLITEDVELKNATTAVTDATYIGYEGGLKWRQDFFDVMEDATYNLDEVIAATDDYVVIANSLVGRGASSGVPVDMRWTSVFWFRDGKIYRAAGFNSRVDALAAAHAPG